ncbi:MAG: S8 family serine peptidase [Waterburya sp.]
MSKFPERLTVGPRNYQTTYELVPDQVLIKVSEDADEEELSTFLRTGSLETATVPEYVQRARRTLEPAGLRWVTLPPGDDETFESARVSLEERSDIEEIRPIYFAGSGGPETAATPMFETVMVQIEDDQADAALEALAVLGLNYNEAFSAALAPISVFTFADDVDLNIENALAIATEASNITGVQSVEFDWLKLETYQLTPNDAFYGNQWNMTTISVEGAWDIETGDSNVWVAIIDSGFDLTHPDLTFTPNTAANPTHCNADDFISGNPTPYNAGSSGIFHGTACAGIAAATINNNRGVAGVAGACQIMPVRLGTTPTSTRVAAGINWARLRGASVGSLSLTTTPTTPAVNAVVNAWNAGMILCAATGNGGGNTSSPPIGFPANHANTIAVGASDRNDERKRPASADGECWGSQYGSEIDVIAPGVQIWTTDEQGSSGYNDNNGGPISWACINYASSGDVNGDYIAVFDGTSAATPHVAGLATLIMSANSSLTNQQVRDLIESTCDKVSPALYTYANTPGRPNGTWHEEVGYGRINAYQALSSAVDTAEVLGR